MSSYYNYRFRCLKIAKGGRKHGMTVDDVYEMCVDMHEKEPSYVMDLYCFVEEKQALDHTPHFMFINTPELAGAIEKSKFQADVVNLPQGQTCISFPKGYKVDGHKAEGVMVSVGNYKTRLKWHNYFFESLGKLPPYYSFANDVSDDGYVSFTHGSPYDFEQVSKLNIPVQSLGAFMQASNVEEMWEVIEGEQFGAPLDDREKAYQLEMCQIAIKTLVYAQAMPEKVTRGVPDRRALPGKRSISGVILNAPSSIESSQASPTTVGYFFRQLRHEKYYRGEHKNKPHGSRWVFVEPHERGMTAQTVNA